jgi:hypothetical protein
MDNATDIKGGTNLVGKIEWKTLFVKFWRRWNKNIKKYFFNEEGVRHGLHSNGSGHNSERTSLKIVLYHHRTKYLVIYLATIRFSRTLLCGFGVFMIWLGNWHWQAVFDKETFKANRPFCNKISPVEVPDLSKQVQKIHFQVSYTNE